MEKTRLYDLALKSTASGMTVHAWSRGFFEQSNALAIGEGNHTEFIERGIYRISTWEYEKRPELFEKFLKRQKPENLENRYAPQERYDAANTKRYNIKLNLKTDADIIEYLDRVPSMQGAIKAALREQMKKGTPE